MEILPLYELLHLKKRNVWLTSIIKIRFNSITEIIA